MAEARGGTGANGAVTCPPRPIVDRGSSVWVVELGATADDDVVIAERPGELAAAAAAPGGAPSGVRLGKPRHVNALGLVAVDRRSPLLVSADAGRTWIERGGGVPRGCARRDAGRRAVRGLQPFLGVQRRRLLLASGRSRPLGDRRDRLGVIRRRSATDQTLGRGRSDGLKRATRTAPSCDAWWRRASSSSEGRDAKRSAASGTAGSSRSPALFRLVVPA
jgi:hypothetical protein